MDRLIDREFQSEQRLFLANLAKVEQMEPEDCDTALAAEKRRHLWAIVGIWRRHNPPAYATAG
jgi:hypothetical protein